MKNYPIITKICNEIENISFEINNPILKVDDTTSCEEGYLTVNCINVHRFLKEYFDVSTEKKSSYITNIFKKRTNTNLKSFSTMFNIFHYMHKKNLYSVEGIGRRSGRYEETEYVRTHLRSNKPLRFQEFTAFELINGIKSYIFKDLDGCITKDALKIMTDVSFEKVVQNPMLFADCLTNILDVNDGYLFVYLLRLLGLISVMENKNKMSSISLAIIFMPIFIGEKKMSKLSIDEIKRLCDIFHKMIESFK